MMQKLKLFSLFALIFGSSLFSVGFSQPTDEAVNIPTEQISEHNLEHEPLPMGIVRDEDLREIEVEKNVSDIKVQNDNFSIIGDNAMSKEFWSKTDSAYHRTISDNVFNIGQHFTTTRKINGELFALGESIVLDKNINDTVFVGGNSISISTAIEGNVWAFGNYFTINGAEIAKDLSILGQSVIVKDSHVSGEINIKGDDIVITNIKAQKLNLNAKKITLVGTIEGEIELESEMIEFQEGARIIGNVHYISSVANPTIENYVEGKTQYIQKIVNDYDTSDDSMFGFLKDFGFWMYVLLLVLLYFVFKNRMNSWSATATDHFGKSFFYGALYYLGLLILPILFLITIVGIPVAIFLWILLFVSIVVSGLMLILLGTRDLSQRLGTTLSKNTLIVLEVLILILLAIVIKILPSWLVIVLSFFVWGSMLHMMFHKEKEIVKIVIEE